MKTSEAIQALRPLASWGKSLAKLEEVLNLVQDKEKIIDEGEARLAAIKSDIAQVDAEYSALQLKHRNGLAEMKNEIAAKRLELDTEFENRKKEIEKGLAQEEGALKDFKENNIKIKNKLQDEIAVLINSKRDKEAELKKLSDDFQTALTNTKQFINKVGEGSGFGKRVD